MASLRISTYETFMGSDELATALKDYESEYCLIELAFLNDYVMLEQRQMRISRLRTHIEPA